VFGPAIVCYVLAVLWAMLPEIKSSFIHSLKIGQTTNWSAAKRSGNSLGDFTTSVYFFHSGAINVDPLQYLYNMTFVE